LSRETVNNRILLTPLITISISSRSVISRCVVTKWEGVHSRQWPLVNRACFSELIASRGLTSIVSGHRADILVNPWEIR
jgi:hypothetical protein